MATPPPQPPILPGRQIAFAQGALKERAGGEKGEAALGTDDAKQHPKLPVCRQRAQRRQTFAMPPCGADASRPFYRWFRLPKCPAADGVLTERREMR
ncbi:hypothetical protein HMPREF0262_01816 [Clostridium sp. ATCC 29733]|nr:hypothetical protein HMPREF0262_01816 [Clostridium sp. ATCC 29733]